ncbi:MAG: thioredoxin family protein [Burkholderiales bacterium]
MNAQHRSAPVTLALAGLLLAAASATATAAPVIGQPAPDFTVPDAAGTPVKLSEFRGKTVVLEWTNPGCPFVAKHYDSGNMQGLQKTWGGKDVVWLSISSTNPRSSDYQKPDQLAALWKKQGAAPRALLMDDDGKVGRLYSARTTPHMYVIDPKGTLVYAGGIDDKRTTNVADVKTAKNYVTAALTEVTAGKPVSTATATPYGCSVKYN